MIKIIKEVDFAKWEEEHDFGEGEWLAHIPKECIKGATLLSKEEYAKHRGNIPKLENYWWLRSIGFCSYSVCGVNCDGGIGNGYSVSSIYHGVRPALILNLQSSNLNFDVGEKVEFGRHMFTILSNDLAICDDIIGEGCFREDSRAKDANDYEKSDVKKYIDNWFDEAYTEYEG